MDTKNANDEGVDSTEVIEDLVHVKTSKLRSHSDGNESGTSS